MKKGILGLMAVWVGMTLAQGKGPAQSPQAGASSSQPVRPLGIVTQLRQGSFTLHTDAGPELLVQLPDAVVVVRVPPGAKDLKTATKIAVSDISVGDRVLVRGRVSDDQKSVLATAVIVMSHGELAKAQDAERADWRQRGTGGLVKAVNPETKEVTISVPNASPTPGNPTRPMIISLAPNATLLRYAPDSVKFSDAKPGTFDQIKVGDQVRALGTKNADGSHYVAEKLVSGTFRNLGATVISIDAAAGAVTVKDLATGKPVVVRTNADSQLHRLPPMIAQMIAAFNAGSMPAGATPAGQGTGGPGGGSPAVAGGGAAGGPGGGPGRGMGGGPRDFQQMLERTPLLTLAELTPGEALIVVSTQGVNPAEVTAIVLLAGVEPILTARPKGSTEVVLGPWNVGMGGGGEAEP